MHRRSISVQNVLLQRAQGHWRTQVAEQFAVLSVATEEMADENRRLKEGSLWNCGKHVFVAHEV